MIKKLICYFIVSLFLLTAVITVDSRLFRDKNLGYTEEWINDRRFLWECPQSVCPEGGYPILFVLHGATQYAESWFLEGNGGFKGSFIWGKRQSEFVDLALDNGFFIIAPDSSKIGKIKAWDSKTSEFSESIDLPFFQNILNWLDDPPCPVNKSRIFCIGFSSGAFMTSRLAYYFGSQFKAVGIHSGGDANLHPLKDAIDHPPTLIIHGKKDRLVDVQAGIDYYNYLHDNGIKSHILLNKYGFHIWQPMFNDLIIDWFLRGYNAADPPLQPSIGPGGSNYTHGSVIVNEYESGGDQYWIFEPGDSTPESAPVIVFNHGWSAVIPRFYQAWIDHLVKKGNIVIYPRYQERIFFVFKKYTDNAINAVKNAINELQNGEHVTPDLDKFAIVGHSLGGGITANMAALAEQEGLPIPKAIMPVQPYLSYSSDADFNNIPEETLMLVIVGEDDTVVGNDSGKQIFYGASQIDLENKDFVIQVTDNYGYPGLIADHHAPVCEYENSWFSIDAMDYFSTWKLFDALTDFAFYGINEEYCFGNTPEQRFMGLWSDNTPVNELIITDTP